MIKLLKIEPRYTIAIDRTEWQLGKSWINVLVLSITYKSLSIPVFWTVLAEKGCSDNAERRAILEKFITEFGVESIRFVTADREFCSKEWLAYLIEKKISYRLRIKASYQISNARGELVRASRLCRTLKSGETLELKGRRKLWNNLVYAAVCKKEDGESGVSDFIRAKREDIVRIRDEVANRNVIRSFENTRISARRYSFKRT